MQIDQFLQPFILAGVASLIVGSVGLGGQWRIQRFLAYSAISYFSFFNELKFEKGRCRNSILIGGST